MARDEHINKLRAVTATSSSEQVRLSADAWLKNAVGLTRLADILESTALEVERGFSDGVAGNPQGTAATGSGAFRLLRERVLHRRDQMDRAGTVLTKASESLGVAEQARIGLPADPGEPPKEPSPYGAQDGNALARAQRVYDAAKSRHDTRSAAYADAEEKARLALLDLDVSYKEAADTLAEIHATEVAPEDLEPPTTGEDNGVDPRLVGAAGAGLLGGPALFGGIRAARGGALSAGAVRPVGATGRTAGAPTLGRTGGAGAAAAGMGAGGRGAGGGIGAMGAARGKGRDQDRPGARRSLDDDGRDWLDEEGGGPGLLS